MKSEVEHTSSWLSVYINNVVDDGPTHNVQQTSDKHSLLCRNHNIISNSKYSYSFQSTFHILNKDYTQYQYVSWSRT